MVKTSPTQANFGSTGGVPRSRKRGGAWRSNGSELEPPLSERSRGTRPEETKQYEKNHPFLCYKPSSPKSISPVNLPCQPSQCRHLYLLGLAHAPETQLSIKLPYR